MYHVMENTPLRDILFGKPDQPKEWGKFWTYWTIGVVALSALWFTGGF